MATFLELVNDVERESGTVNQAQWLGSVVGATGRQRKIVDWVRQAWEMIQRERQDWTFRRLQFSRALVIGQMVYTAAELGITDFGGWQRDADDFQPFTLYDSTIGRSDETRLELIAYRRWLDAYDRGAPANVRPMCVAPAWSRSLALGPPPDKAYVLRGWYTKAIQRLAANTDEPFIDEEFHQAIVWRALMLLGDDDEAVFEVASSRANYASAFSALLAAYTDPIEV